MIARKSLFIILLVGISGACLHSDAHAQPADQEKMFPDGVTHDFGGVLRGTKLYYAFRIVNTSDVPLRIVSVAMSSRGLDSARANKDVLQPKEEGLVEVIVNTQTFLGPRNRYIYVIVDNGNGKLAEHRLWLAAVSIRTNEAFFPDDFDFGKVTRGDTPTKHVIVAIPNQPQLRLTAATCDSKCVQIKLQELGRGDAMAIYKVSATLQADAPKDALHNDVELTTNNPSMPKLRVPLRAVVEPAK